MIKVIDRGLAPYDEVLKEQQYIFDSLVARQKSGEEITDETIIIVEHPHVFTMGVHAHSANMLVNDVWLQNNGIHCVKIKRGGDITYHGPGQIVVYPIISLQKHRLGVKQYVTLLEQAVIDTLAEWGIIADRVDGATGVWVMAENGENRKICAIGIRCSRFITMHGLALNVNTDLTYFSYINPCGFTRKNISTSLEDLLGHKVDISTVKSRLIANLLRLLDSF